MFGTARRFKLAISAKAAKIGTVQNEARISNADACNRVSIDIPWPPIPIMQPNMLARPDQVLLCLALGWVCAPLLLADAPEELLWKDIQRCSQPEMIGPRNQPVDLKKYAVIQYVSGSPLALAGADGSAEHPWSSLNHALSEIPKAGPNNKCALLVAAGTYREGCIYMQEHVDLYGGFEADTWKRDIFAHRTILNGQDRGRVVLASNHATLDGFIVTSGSADWHGGGILCHRSAPTITNNFITRNTTLQPVGFIHNSTRRRHLGNDGGGIACVDGAHAIIAHNAIYDNATEIGNGGGIACRDDSCPLIQFNVIQENRTGLKDIHNTRSSSGGGIACFAGALPLISNNLLANNQVGGGSDGGAVFCEYNSSPEILFNFFLGNHAEDDGGAIEIMKSSQPVIGQNIFMGNETRGGGGAIRMTDQGLARITGNLIARNTARSKGGGVACTNGWMILEENTILENQSRRSGGVICYNKLWPHLNPPVIRRNIIRGNAHRQIEVDGGPVTNNNIQGGFAGPANQDVALTYEEDGLTGRVTVCRYDQLHFTTTVVIQDAGLAPDAWAGRVIRLGRLWTLIVSNSDSELVVWGEVCDQATSFEIIKSYNWN